jgi:hypothetical protein
MKRRGREVCRGLGDLGDQLRLMGRPGPSDPVWTTRSRFYRRRLCGRKKSERAASLSVGPEGLAGRLGVHRRSLHPGTGFRPPFHVAYIAPRLASVRSVTELAAQLGHARKSMTLDTYAHVLLDA